jgi:hypothetical protein
MELILGTHYQIKKAKKAHEYLRYDAPDDVRLGYDALGKGMYYGGRMAGLGIGYGVAVTPYAGWKLGQSLYYVGVKGIDFGASALVCGASKLLRNIPGTDVETKYDLYGWLKWARPSTRRTFEGWTPYGFRAQVPGPDRGNGGAPRPGGWWGFNMRPPWGYLQAPEWQWENPELPVRAHGFDPTKVVKGLEESTPQELIEFNTWLSDVMIADAEAMKRLILTDRFPARNPDGTPHPQANQSVFMNRRPVYQVAGIADRARMRFEVAESAPMGQVRNRHLAAAVELQRAAERTAREIGFANAREAVEARDADMDRLLAVNAMNFTNILQRQFECKEAEHTLKLILKMHDKDLLHTMILGYLGYYSIHGSGAEKSGQ